MCCYSENHRKKDANQVENVVRLCVKGWCKYDVMGTWCGENVLCEKRKELACRYLSTRKTYHEHGKRWEQKAEENKCVLMCCDVLWWKRVCEHGKWKKRCLVTQKPYTLNTVKVGIQRGTGKPMTKLCVKGDGASCRYSTSQPRCPQ